MDTVTTPTAGSSDANTPADDLSTLVRDISSMVPVSNIDKTQARHPVEQNFLESTRLDDETAVEACLREETRLVESVEEIERIRDRENSDSDLREIIRNKTGPADLRHTNLNRDTDARELLQREAGPSDLRYSKLKPEKDLRDFIKPKLLTKDGPGTSALTAISAYESTSSEEDRVKLPMIDNGTPKRRKPLAPTDLRRRLDGEAASKIPHQRKHPTQLTKTDLRRKLNVAQKILYRDPIPQKPAPNCNEEHCRAPPPPPPNRNWWDDPEEDE